MFGKIGDVRIMPDCAPLCVIMLDYALKKALPLGKAPKNNELYSKDYNLLKMFQDDLHLAWCEQLPIDGTKFGNKGSDPPAHGALVHAPTQGKLSDGHGMDWLIHSL